VRRVRISLFILGLLLILATLGGVLFHFASAVDPAEVQSAPARAIPNTDVNPYGANFFLAREVEEWKREKTIQMAKEAGIGWVKQHFVWAEVEPRRKGEFVDEASGESTWRKYDQIVDLCEKYGLQIIARLDRPPDWTRQDNAYPERPPDDFDDYGDFVYEFVKHYQGRVHYIQIWNEPNIFPEWGDQEVNPAQYVELLKVAYRRAKEADPNVYVLSAPLAITLEEFPIRRNLNDLVFLEEMYQAGAKDYFDILSANAFGFEYPPDDPPDPGVLNFSRVLLQREIMEKHGDADKPVWLNEYGWNAAPDDPLHFSEEELPWKRVDEEQQAEYTLRGIEEARAKWPWVGVFNIWYFRQVGHFSPDQPEYYFRMVDVDFTPRRVYYAVKDAAVALRVAGAGHYEETHSAVVADSGWRAVIEPRASGEAHLVSESPGASLSFTFKGDGVSLLTWRGNQAGRLLVTLDGRDVAGLPVDDKGRSYVDLYDPATQWQAWVPLVSGAGNGQHVLRLTVSDEGNPASNGHHCSMDAFQVAPPPPPSFPYIPVAGLGLGALIATWLLYRELRSRS